MSSFSRFRDASDDNRRRGCASESSLDRTAAYYGLKRNEADSNLREKQAQERDSRKDC